MTITVYLFIHLTSLLNFFTPCGLIRRLAPKPNRNKRYPARNGNPDTSNPYPSTTDHPAPRPLIVCEMSDGNLLLDLSAGKERALVVDFECEYAVLVW